LNLVFVTMPLTMDERLTANESDQFRLLAGVPLALADGPVPNLRSLDISFDH